MAKKTIRILCGEYNGSGDIDWQQRIPEQWNDPGSPRLMTIPGIPDTDVRPQARLIFRNKNKPIFAAEWQKNAFISVYDPKGHTKEKAGKAIDAMGIGRFPEPEPGILVAYGAYTIPVSVSKAKREQMMGAPKITKPDADNFVKYYMDVMQGRMIPPDHKISTVLVHQMHGANPGVMLYYHPGDIREGLKIGLRLGLVFKHYACSTLALSFGETHDVIHELAGRDA